MSVFLGFSSGLIPSGATAISMQSTFASLIASYGWQIIRQAVVPTAYVGTFTNPANAFTLNTQNYANTTTLPAYIGCNISTGFIPVNMYLQADTDTAATSGPLTFTLDYSSNGSSWTTLQTFTSQTGWTSCERRKYAISSATSQTYWRINITAVQSGTTSYIHEWTLEDANGNWLVSQPFFDCIPPTTEVIGNSNARDVLRWLFPVAGTSIQFRPIQEQLSTIPQMLSWYTATAGAVTLSITINSNTVSYTGIASNTSAQNARGLYEACKNSANTNFTNWTWVWNSTSATTLLTSPNQFYAIRNTIGMNLVTTSVNITTQQRSTSVYQVPQAQGSQFVSAYTVTTDIINGWIYYLQVCSRGIAMSSKTNSNYYTPVHMCYGDNASAIAQVPVADLAQYGIPCTPIELLVGTDSVVANTDAAAYASHAWGVAQPSSTYMESIGYIDYNTVYGNIGSPFAHHNVANQMQDWPTNVAVMNANVQLGCGTFEMSGEGFFQGADSGNAYSIHRIGCTPGWNWNYVGGWAGNYVKNTGPNFINLDWYKFTGTAPSNEQLLISPCNDFTTTISTTGLNTDTTINVASTTGFPSSGWLVLDGEIINYTGITSTQFTGCVRGKYMTMPVAPMSGTTIYIAAWFVFIVQGLIFGGYQLP